MVRNAALVATVLALSACGAEPTQVFVHFEVPSALEARARQLSVVVYGDGGERVLARVDPIPPIGQLPIVPVDGDATRRFRVDASLLDEAGVVIARGTIEEGFEEGIVRDVTLVLVEVPPRVARSGIVCVVMDDSATATGGHEVRGSQCAFTPVSPDEVYIVLASGTLVAAGNTDTGGDLRLFIDGEERGYGAAAGTLGQAWQAMAWVTGDAIEHVVSLNIRGTPTRGSSIEEARIVIFPLSANADFHAASRPGDFVVGAEDTVVVELALAPRAPGRYVILVDAAAGERPGGAGIEHWVETPSGRWPADAISFGRIPLIPHVRAQVVDVPIEGGRWALVGRLGTGTDGATVRGAKILAFRADDFASVVSAANDELHTAGASPVTVLSASAPAGPASSTWVTFQHELVAVDTLTTPEEPPGEATLTFSRDGTVVRTAHQHAINRGDEYSVSFADLVETSAGLAVSADAALGSSESSGTAVRVLGGSAVLLEL